MTKKIKDLNLKEIHKICAKYTQHGLILCENSNCPLQFANSCLSSFIEKIKYLEKEVKINE